MAKQIPGARFLLWIDGVGGYLVCLANETVLGQATLDNPVDVPIQADVSRQHAKIHRQGDGYIIEPFHATWVNGQAIHGKTLLSPGDLLELGRGVRLFFRQPHALSASARLDFASRHRTSPRADGILLMAESCVLGPQRRNHVICRDWENDVVLYRRDGELCCRAVDSIEIDGQRCDGRATLAPNSHVSGSDFSMSLEALV
ncbi:MAG: FHA domain-containing protein [Planctomycetota bacterium]